MFQGASSNVLATCSHGHLMTLHWLEDGQPYSRSRRDEAEHGIGRWDRRGEMKMNVKVPLASYC